MTGYGFSSVTGCSALHGVKPSTKKITGSCSKCYTKHSSLPIWKAIFRHKHAYVYIYICSYTCAKCMFPKLFLSAGWPACLCFGNPCWSRLYSFPLSLPQGLSFQIERSPRLSPPTNILSMYHHRRFSLAVPVELLYRQELKVVALPNLCSGYVILLMLLPDSALRTYLPSSF